MGPRAAWESEPHVQKQNFMMRRQRIKPEAGPWRHGTRGSAQVSQPQGRRFGLGSRKTLNPGRFLGGGVPPHRRGEETLACGLQGAGCRVASHAFPTVDEQEQVSSPSRGQRALWYSAPRTPSWLLRRTGGGAAPPSGTGPVLAAARLQSLLRSEFILGVDEDAHRPAHTFLAKSRWGRNHVCRSGQFSQTCNFSGKHGVFKQKKVSNEGPSCRPGTCGFNSNLLRKVGFGAFLHMYVETDIRGNRHTCFSCRWMCPLNGSSVLSLRGGWRKCSPLLSHLSEGT